MARIKYFNTETQQWEYADKAGMAHNHNDIYYTEAEVNSLLENKADAEHSHDDVYYTETEVDAKINDLTEVYVQDTTPVNPKVGDIWVDISVEPSLEIQPLSILQGGTGATNAADARANLGIAPAFSSGATILSSYQYGDTLPADSEATEGRIFFKKAEV